MSLFSAYGFSIRVLHKDDSDDIYRVFEEILVRKNVDSRQIGRDMRILQGEIKFALKNKRHVIIGLEKDGILVGAAMCNDSGNIPWIGHLNILKKYRYSKAVLVLMHYIINILFKDKNVSVGKENVELFEKNLLPETTLLQIRIFNPDLGIRLQKLIDKDN